MNGSVGRARALKRIRRKRLADAVAAGVDINDSAAVRAFHDKQFNELCDRLVSTSRKKLS